MSPDAPLPVDAVEVRGRVTSRGASCAFLGADGVVVGAIVIEDPLRPDAADVFRHVRRLGIERVIMVTGDHPDVASSVAATLGLTRSCPSAPRSRRSRRLHRHGVAASPRSWVTRSTMHRPWLRPTSASRWALEVRLPLRRQPTSSSPSTASTGWSTRSRSPSARGRSRGRAPSWAWAWRSDACSWQRSGCCNPSAELVQELIDVAAILNALRALGGRSEHRP